MQLFTNRFNVMLNQDKTEAIINFYQHAPTVQGIEDADSNAIELKIEPVANLVMTGQCARNLLQVLQDLLNETPSTGPAPEPK